MAFKPQPQGPPYLPQTAVLGGHPTVDLDVPVSAVFLCLFTAGAAFNMIVFQINLRHGYKFLFSVLLFGFCMARILALATRIAWATDPEDVNVAIASQIFTAAGVMLLFVTNLIFTQRIIRAYHPFFGWNPAASRLFKVLFLSIVAILIAVVTATVHSFFTLDPDARRTDRDIQLFCGTYLAVVAFLPIPLLVVAALIPRRTRIDKFGQGHFSTKFALLTFTAMLLATGAVFRATTAYYSRPIRNPAWFHSKACYYCFNFGIELLVVYIYALSRFDKRFHVPDGSSAPGHYSCSEDDRGMTTPERSSQRTTGPRGSTGMNSLADFEKPSAAYLYNSNKDSRRSSVPTYLYSNKRASGSSEKSKRRSIGILPMTTKKSAERPRSAPWSVTSIHEEPPSDTQSLIMEEDMEWVARAMRELYGDDDEAESSHGAEAT
ncbi:hypothetical protein B0H66DRAFT_582246 [Apodospora peruviana]|uniref:Uncharacterized protein n=1 Tax=Apodospora peruviana TaxID=516989 RepID=A0AAE0M4D9_9PEZI|nr:hypothetical protein B0H66DRAFT_582246 [Apodospora peruviana]